MYVVAPGHDAELSPTRMFLPSRTKLGSSWSEQPVREGEVRGQITIEELSGAVGEAEADAA